MHVAMVIGGGVLLLGVFALFGHLWHLGVPLAAQAFVPVWLVVALVNMWIGVSRAGYTVMQELPILLPVFAVPAALALGIVWYAARGA